MREDEIITSEGTVLSASAAATPLRAIGWLLDQLAELFVFFILYELLALSGALAFLFQNFDDASGAAFVAIIILAYIVIYPTLFEWASGGRSPGKFALGCRVVRDDGGRIRLHHAFIRHLMSTVDFWLTTGSLAICCSLLSRRNKRVGDHLAGTYVLHYPAHYRLIPRLMMPPQLASWASCVDLRPLPDGLALRARQFLVEYHHLSPGARRDFAADIARDLHDYVSPQPPLGTPPEAFIAGLLTVRRDRALLSANRRKRSLTPIMKDVDALPEPAGVGAPGASF